MINILILSAGTRDKVVQYFKEALDGKGKVIATDCSPYAPAIYEADEYVLVPRITEPGYLDKILEICREKQITGVLSLIDPELSLLADNKERFLEVGTVPIVPDAKQVDICFHKYAMYEACKALGFATGRCFLDRKEHSEIDLTSEFAKCRDHIRAAYEKADPCTCYIKGLGKAEEFYANLLCSFCCKETSTMCSVKDDVAVCIVMDNYNIVFFCKCNNFFIKSRCGNASYRVGWKRDYHVTGLASHIFRNILYIWQEIMLCYKRVVVRNCCLLYTSPSPRD